MGITSLKAAVAAVFVTGALVAVALPQPATAAVAVTEIVYVDPSGADPHWYWQIRDALATVDPYTGSQMVVGKCISGYRCIHIKEAVSQWAAFTDFPNPWFARIYLNPSSLNQPYWWEKRLVRHELGHAHGLGHAPNCDSVMNTNITCWWIFNATEATFLRNR